MSKPFANKLAIIERLPMWLAALALFVLMVMTFTDVIMRSVFNSPLEAATELTRILVAITVFSALPVISSRGDHISVDLLDSFYNKTLARFRDALMAIACGVMLYWPLQKVLVLARRAREYGDVTEYLNIPQFYIAYFIALSVAITAVALIVRGFILLFKK
ncbi:MAG: TRAP transporter small permease [Granulosicoccaceae bacterium]